jgi:hypothetical protein
LNFEQSSLRARGLTVVDEHLRPLRWWAQSASGASRSRTKQFDNKTKNILIEIQGAESGKKPHCKRKSKLLCFKYSGNEGAL